jgi:CelD/BcsL family acetyltransferase involved in cellulose biosynthesis
MLQAETIHPSDLSDADAAAWRALCAGRPAFDHPLLGPDFAQAVGQVRSDARVAIWRRDGAAVGFLPHHRRPGGLARPIGAPLSDYHALVCDETLDIPAALERAGLKAFRFSGLVDPDDSFAPFVAAHQDGFLITLDDGPEAYIETLRAASPKRFKNYRRLDSKLEREVGVLDLRADDRREAFETMIAWKREQLARTGLHDFMRPDWTRDLLDALFARRDGEFQGLMVSLYAGDKLACAHFGVVQRGVYHPWIASTAPELAAWSPGQVFLLRAIAAMPRLGVSTYDLGLGHEHYKRPYTLSTRTVAGGLATASGAGGRVAQASERAWVLAGAHGSGPVGRLRRRLDAIATVELSLAGRARGFAEALASTGRRAAAMPDIS